MRTYRSHFYPHLLFLALLVILAIGGVLRVYHHVEELARSRQALAHATRDAIHLDEVHRELVEAQRQWLEGGSEPWKEPPFRRALAALRFSVRVPLAGESTLTDSVSYHRLQLMVEAVYQELLAAPDALTRAETAMPRFSHMLVTWSAIQRSVVRELQRQAVDLLDRRRSIIHEASIAFVLIVMVAVLYLHAVNRYLARPVEDLADVARGVTRGDLTARALPAGGGPVASLAVDFNRMVDILVDSLAEEERVVTELQRKTHELEAANLHKSRFLANISHELKTPLSAIIGFTDILDSGLHGDLAERQREYLRRIGSASQHLLLMISDLIDIAKIDVGALSLTITSVEIGEVARDVADLVLPQCSRKQHRLHLDLPAGLPAVEADRERVRQILINLVANAIKFTPEGGEIKLSAAVEGDLLRIDVNDTGIGIAPEHQETIFEDFVQLDSRLHRQHEGTGIGLAISRRLADMMRATLTVVSTPAQGSTFSLRLPLYSRPTQN